MSTLHDPSHDTIPFIYNGDSYIVHLELHPLHVQILHVLLYPNNQNYSPTQEDFRDLDPHARALALGKINRKHPGKMVKT
jgi:hypothetical protein